MKKITAFILTLMMAVTFMPMNANAAVKPAKVKKPKVVKVYKKAAKIRWKKARGAKKYQVYLGRYVYGEHKKKVKEYALITSGKNKGKEIPYYTTEKVNGYFYKYKKVKTLKKRSFVVKKLKGGETYRVKIRGINGKRKGKFSKSVKIKPKAKPVVKKVSNPKKIKKPGWYRYKNPFTGQVETVKILKVKKDGDEYQYVAKKNGGEYIISDKGFSWNYVNWDNVKNESEISNSLYECSPTSSVPGGYAFMTKAKKKDVVIKWTLDGTDPALVKKDKWGHCEYTIGRKYYNGRRIDMVYLDTYIQGITKYGKPRLVFRNNPCLIGEEQYPRVFWFKIYKSGKLVFDDYFQNFR